MDENLSVSLLKWIKNGKLEIKENNKKSMEFIAKNNRITINLIDISFNVPSSKNIFSRLSEARDFAKKLKDQDLTLCISHKNKLVMKLGKEAKPKLSRMITRSSAVQIMDLGELRRLDKRLRQK